MGRKNEKSRRSEQREKKKGSSGVAIDPEEEFKGAPHTFIINRGAVGKNVTHLIRDMRRVMEPFTASHLKTTKRNVLKDFVNVAGMLNVSHMMLFTKNENGTNLRVVRSPRGPTLTFHVEQYTLSSDVVSSLKRPNMEARQFQHHPLLVMNNFSGEGKEMSLMATMFQNMFPSINVNKVKLNSIRRCVMINYNSDTEMVEFRHYNIKAVPVGMSRGVKKLIQAKVPNLDKFDDVSEFLLRGGELSESEAELDGPHNEVVLPQDVGSRGNIKSSKSAIRLTEIGPRMTLKLVKVEEGVCDGEVLYHKYRSLSADDIKYMETKRKLKKETKEKRKAIQAENVKKKVAEKERLKQLSLEGMKKKAESLNAAKDASDSDSEQPDQPQQQGGGNENEADDDDVEYYKEEVGEEPDADTRLSLKRKAPSGPPKKPFKRKKFNSDGQNKEGRGEGKFNKHNKGQNPDKFDKKGRGGKMGRFNKDDKFSKGGKFDRGDKFGKDKFDKKGKTFGRGQKGGRGSTSRGGRGPTSRGGRGRGSGGRGRGRR